MKKLNKIILIIFLVTMNSAVGQNEKHTLKYVDSIGYFEADLNDVKWISGHWKGEALGGNTEEVWTSPFGGSIECMFKLVVNNKVTFYEFLTITEENNSLILRLKHFNSDLKGWEEKDERLEFKLVKVTKNRIYFDDFTFEKVSENEMNIYVVFYNEGKKTEMKFYYKKRN